MGSSKRVVGMKKTINMKRRKVGKEDIAEHPGGDTDNVEGFFLTHAFRPPYQILLDTNFINDCVRRKLDIGEELGKAVNGSINMCVPECVIGELEKLGRPFRVALALAREDGIKRLGCDHKGIYADDCILNRVSIHRCYIVATSDTNLRQRIKKIPGVPLIMYKGRKCSIERFMPATL